MTNYLWLIAGVVAGYLLGSVSTSVWTGKLFFGVDVREQGSGNAGATNTFRVLGWKAALVVMTIDILKAWVAVQLAPLFAQGFLDPEQLVNYRIAVGAAAVVGHVFPIYTGFRGGKGVASIVGVIISLYPLVIPFVLVLFVLILLLTGYVSLGSVTCSLVFPVLVIVAFKESNISLIVLSLLVALFVPLTHIKNIKRLIKGTENKIRFKKNEASK